MSTKLLMNNCNSTSTGRAKKAHTCSKTAPILTTTTTIPVIYARAKPLDRHEGLYPQGELSIAHTKPIDQ